VTDHEAYVLLNFVSGIGTAKFRGLNEIFGSPSAIFAQSAARLAGIKGISQKLANALADPENSTKLQKEFELAAKGGTRIITLADPEYPECLRNIYDPPFCLYVRGNLPELGDGCIAIVGSRRPSRYGRKMTEHLTSQAVGAGWKVISGLAYGIDAVAHKATVDCGGITVAVLGGGLMRVHPQDNIPLARSIVESGGAIVSEFPMEYPVNRQSFPRRNRIVAAMGAATLVVEAGLNSGALITADLAAEQGRSVFAVPGQADNELARGCHKLIRQGAKLTEDFEDILNDFEFLPGLGYNTRETPLGYNATVGDHTTIDLDPLGQRIVGLLETEEKAFDTLIAELEINAAELMSALMKLELQMVISQAPGRLYSLRR
jgi:DNA processing protein